MKYKEGKLGRIFVLKFENQDDFIEETKKFIKKEKISTAFFVYLGALEQAGIVCGPRKAVNPPVPFEENVRDGWEVFGTGSVFLNKKKEPQIHIHASMGKGKNSRMGCVRKDAKVFNVIEGMVIEVKGVKTLKDIQPENGLNMLQLL
jgi:predicted DNA-binding protein with PD1-like motif